MKKGWIPALLVSAAVLLLLLINTYGRQGLQTGLAAESASGEAAWHSYAPHLTLPRGEYRVLVGGYGPVVVRSGEGNLLGAGDAGEPFLIRLEKDESEVIFHGWQEGVLLSLELSPAGGGPVYSDGLLVSLGIAAVVLILGLAGWRMRGFNRQGEEEKRVGIFIFCVLLGVTVLASYPL